MKYFKIILAIGLVILIKACVGFMDCYDRLILINENSNTVLLKDSSAFISNDDFDFILNECVTDCTYDSLARNKRFVFIKTNFIPNKKIILKKNNFVLTDSLNNDYTADRFIINESGYDSLILLPDNNYRIRITFFTEYEKGEYFYSPFKINFRYRLSDEDTLKYFLNDYVFGVKPWAEIAEEWSNEKK